MIRFIFLNELSILPATMYLLLGHKVCILTVCPYLKIFESLVRKCETLIYVWKPMASLKNTFEDMPWLEGKPADTVHTSFFINAGDTFYRQQKPTKLPKPLLKYAYAFQKTYTDYTSYLLPSLSVINWLKETHGQQEFGFIGAPSHFLKMMKFSGALQDAFETRTIYYLFLVNLMNAVSIWVWAVLNLLAKTRPFISPNSPMSLGVDSFDGMDAQRLIKGIFDDPASEGLIIYRNKSAKEKYSNCVSTEFSQCQVGDTKVCLTKFLTLSCRITCDVYSVWRACHSLDPQLFVRNCILSAKGSLFSAFFWRFPVRYFWGRDEYSVDHIIRNIELREIGGKSIGILHGVPPDTFHQHWREIDFDTFYVPCLALYEKCFKKNWPSEMDVQAIGNRHLTLKHSKKMREPVSKDMVFFPIVHREFKKISDEVIKIAEYFSDRVVYVKFKAGRAKRHQQEFQNFLDMAPSNVVTVDSTESPYELMLKCRYVISSGSTLGVEAIQYNRASFVFDLDPKFSNFFFRNIPDTIVKNSQDVIEKIDAIENENATYPFSKIANTLGLNPELFLVTLHNKLSPLHSTDIGSPRHLRATENFIVKPAN